MERVIERGCRTAIAVCILAWALVCICPAHAIDPDRCSSAELGRMGDEAADEILDLIRGLESEIASYRQMMDDSVRSLSLAERRLKELMEELKDIQLRIRLGLNLPGFPSHGLKAEESRRLAEIASLQESVASWRRNIAAIQENIDFRLKQITILREKLNALVNAFANLISNSSNHSRSIVYETACKLKNATDSEDVSNIMNPIKDPPSMWRRLLPDPSRDMRSQQGGNYRSSWSGCFNAVAAIGGAIITLWPSDSVQAGQSPAPSVNYPIWRGPNTHGSPICPPEPPLSCPPSPYVCPEEPPVAPTATAVPTRGSSSSSHSSSSSQANEE